MILFRELDIGWCPKRAVRGPTKVLLGSNKGHAHLLDDLLLLNQESAHDAVLDHPVAEVSSVDAVHRLGWPRQPLIAHLLGPQRLDLRSSPCTVRTRARTDMHSHAIAGLIAVPLLMTPLSSCIAARPVIHAPCHISESGSVKASSLAC